MQITVRHLLVQVFRRITCVFKVLLSLQLWKLFFPSMLPEQDVYLKIRSWYKNYLQRVCLYD